ncbi:MAG: type IX secretion system membrane protein PorP/SprF [Bacteroidales bacterium]|jgi:type IX secretion system PorP/SprF family membrane protein|nr:type IX secretion system membrane protein PorP/SprF [Bacteroidales bacterium]
MKRTVFTLLIAMLGLGAFAQQDALFSQYMFNKLIINPAYAGSRDGLSMTMVGRRQWVGIDDGPQTLSFSIQSPLRNEHIGLGFYCYTDVLGPFQATGAIGTFSYRIKLGRGHLSFGIQAGIKHTYFDLNKLNVQDETDVVLDGSFSKQIVPDANFGIYYNTERFYVGVSSKHLFEQEYGYLQKPNSQSVYGTLARHFYAMAGVAIPLSDNLVLRPSTLIKYAQNAPVQVDINASLLIREVLWLGASYRTKEAVVLLAEIVIAKNLRIGYSYDIYMNEIQQYNRGSHEVMLEYNIPIIKNRMLTPRYF